MEQPLKQEEELYAELFTPLFRYFFLRTKEYDLASDLTQSAFLKYLLQDNRPVGREHSLRLMFTIARTTLIDHWRVQGKRHTMSIEASDFDMPSDEPSPERRYEIAERKSALQTIMATLSESEQEIVALRLSADMDYVAIAETLGITPDNARQKYSRALAKIKTLLKNNQSIL